MSRYIPVEQRERAARAVRLRMVTRGMSVLGLARTAGIDARTAQRFTRGQTWPREGVRNAIESSLDWKPGMIARLATVPLALRDFTASELAEELLRRARESECARS